MRNTAILLILRDHMIPYRIEDGVVQVLTTDCVLAEPGIKPAWIKVPDIVSALWVVGKL